MKLQAAVKEETKKVAIYEIIGVVAMLIIWFVLHLLWPDSIPFDYKVILAAILGGAVAVLNFLFLGISVQKLTTLTDEAEGKQYFKNVYRKRMLFQIVWGILALVLPCFNGIAGLIPLLFPTFAIRAVGIKSAIISNFKNKKGDD